MSVVPERMKRAVVALSGMVLTAGSIHGCATVTQDPNAGDTSSAITSGSGGASSASASQAAASGFTSATVNSTASSSTATSAMSSATATSTTATGTTAATSSSTGASDTATVTGSTGGVGGSTSSSATTGGGAGGMSSTGGVSTATDGTAGMGGSTASTATMTSSTTGANATCDDPRMPAEQAASNGNTGAFDTAEGVCYFIPFTPGQFAGWDCSNFSGPGANDERSVTANGTEVDCGELPLPEPIDGGYYFEFGPGDNTSASMYWYNWE